MVGEMLLAVGQPRDALGAFEASLRVAPNRYRSIAGAAKAAESTATAKPPGPGMGDCCSSRLRPTMSVRRWRQHEPFWPIRAVQ